jgi:hypothetical protein
MTSNLLAWLGCSILQSMGVEYANIERCGCLLLFLSRPRHPPHYFALFTSGQVRSDQLSLVVPVVCRGSVCSIVWCFLFVELCVWQISHHRSHGAHSGWNERQDVANEKKHQLDEVFLGSCYDVDDFCSAALYSTYFASGWCLEHCSIYHILACD